MRRAPSTGRRYRCTGPGKEQYRPFEKRQRRLTPGAKRRGNPRGCPQGRPISHRRRPKVGLPGPSAGGRPAPSFRKASTKVDARRGAPRGGRFLIGADRRSAFLGLRPEDGLRRPFGKRQRRLTPGAKCRGNSRSCPQGRPISHRRRPKVSLPGPPAGGRPAPSLRKASTKVDAWHGGVQERPISHRRRPKVGLPGPPAGGRPAPSLRKASTKVDAWRRSAQGRLISHRRM